jgi:hypothetical protein
VLLALTAQDETNLVACQIAQKSFGVPRTIALFGVVCRFVSSIVKLPGADGESRHQFKGL